ncbi:YlbF family regulator [Sporohalobacter salinus]|uniref:YlbF family regulator n=1 Tax=Sporohalobacter salinus TaxID=1494606 RepID=UPI00195FF3F0|nr:YlbF family regulator [Sporohalobacter salinus]MBM7624115.1 cell fate (sporulation/competence/biofilm development) regulator YlbF (YheA/YmcA/DUF963 family) [Sporohalobacter salinus]
MSIMDKAEELGDEILESSEYNELKAAEEAVESDETAKSLLDEFQAAQKRLQMAQANGQEVTQEQQQEIQSIQAKMQENEKIKEFMEAQQNFNKIMQTVNQVITSALQGEEEAAADQCGGCSGC